MASKTAKHKRFARTATSRKRYSKQKDLDFYVTITRGIGAPLLDGLVTPRAGHGTLVMLSERGEHGSGAEWVRYSVAVGGEAIGIGDVALTPPVERAIALARAASLAMLYGAHTWKPYGFAGSGIVTYTRRADGETQQVTEAVSVVCR